MPRGRRCEPLAPWRRSRPPPTAWVVAALLRRRCGGIRAPCHSARPGWRRPQRRRRRARDAPRPRPRSRPGRRHALRRHPRRAVPGEARGPAGAGEPAHTRPHGVHGGRTQRLPGHRPPGHHPARAQPPSAWWSQPTAAPPGARCRSPARRTSTLRWRHGRVYGSDALTGRFMVSPDRRTWRRAARWPWRTSPSAAGTPTSS